MSGVFIRTLDVYDDSGIHLATLKRFDEDGFEIKAKGLLEPTELREIADLVEALNRSSG